MRRQTSQCRKGYFSAGFVFVSEWLSSGISDLVMIFTRTKLPNERSRVPIAVQQEFAGVSLRVRRAHSSPPVALVVASEAGVNAAVFVTRVFRSEEHTSELQSLRHLVCR